MIGENQARAMYERQIMCVWAYVKCHPFGNDINRCLGKNNKLPTERNRADAMGVQLASHDVGFMRVPDLPR